MSEVRPVLETLAAVWADLLAFLPRLALAAVILIAGWLLARLLRRLLLRLLRIARVDEAAERTGIDDFLVQGGVRSTTATLLANAVYWLIVLAAILAVLGSLGLDTASRLGHRLATAVPNGVAALMMVVLGALFAKLVQTLVFSYLSNVGVSAARGISTLARAAVLVLVLAAGLEELNIGGQVLVSAFQIAFGAFCLALALAFGLGGREWAARILEAWWKK